jgi:uncharacterized membrane protein
MTTPLTEKSSSGLDANVAAALSYVFGFVTGIIFFVIEKDSRFVKFHAMQSILWSIVFLVVWSVLWGVAWWIMWLLGLPIWLAAVILWILLMVKAYNGEWFKLPLIGDFAEQQAGKFGAPPASGAA